MIYTVRITTQALEELDAAFAWLIQRTDQHAPARLVRISFPSFIVTIHPFPHPPPFRYNPLNQ